MRYSEIIELTEEFMNFAHSGKFWYDTKNREAYRVRGHHTLAAFEIPELAQALKSVLGSEYELFVANTRRAAKDFFSGDTNDSNDPYLGMHDKVCMILCNAGFIRGINDLVFFVALTSRYEKGCRELIAMRSPSIVQFDLVDLQKSGELKGADLDLFVRGRSLKAFANKAFR